MSSRNEIREIVIECIGNALMTELHKEDIKESEELIQLGVNSLNYVKLGILLEERFAIDMTMQELDFSKSAFRTIGAVVDMIEEKQKGRQGIR